ncbi:hypothetical protein ACFVWY_29380 [Streptomyces sp. NPDC058195]|uniref:hypothetical protein n=1 Tax=Streptomyces sp. NPDC058195 TaxID=3346375 RepID=UPI0036ED1797
MIDGQRNETDSAAEERVVAHRCTIASGLLPHHRDADHVAFITHSNRCTEAEPEPFLVNIREPADRQSLLKLVDKRCR